MGEDQKLISVLDFVRLPRRYMRVYGMYSSVRNRRLTIDFKTVLFAVTTLVLLLTTFGEIAYCIWSLIKNTGVKFELLYTGMCIGYLVLGVGKLIAFMNNLNEISELLLQIEDEHPRTRNAQKEFNVQHYLDLSNRMVFRQAFVFVFMMTIFNLNPLFASFINYFARGEWNIDLPYNLLYPFNPYRRGVFETIYLLTVWAAYSSTIAISCLDISVCCIVQLICMHFNQLTCTLRDHDPERVSVVEQKAFLLSIVEKHNKIFE